MHLDGARIHYRVDQPLAASGERAPDPYALPAVLLLHGGYLDLREWDSVATDLVRSGMRVIRFSDLGHGKTVGGPAPIAAIRIIRHLLDTLQAPRVSMVGHSWGGAQAIDFALADPHRVDRLVLMAPGVQGWDYFQDSTMAQWTRLRQAAMQAGDTLAAADWFVRSWVDGPHREAAQVDPQARARAAAMVRLNFLRHGGADWSLLSDRVHLDLLEQLQAPTLVLTGALDAADIHAIADALVFAVPEVQLLQFDGVGHALPHEMPHIGRSILVDFLDGGL